jgi:UDPglucose 6-dehydrogenase
MNVSIFGAGYVGLVVGNCLASLGHQVIIVDIDEKRIARLSKGELPIDEPELAMLFQENRHAKRVDFTTDVVFSVSHAEIIFITVNTPTAGGGQTDIRFVEQAAHDIAGAMMSPKTIVIKSTVPPGTAEQVKEIIFKNRKVHVEFDVISNPEFLQEGSAVQDFLSPNRIIIGADQEESLEKMRHLYAPIIARGFPLVPMSTHSAELSKYAANAFLAMKISFINEISRLSEFVNGNIHDVQKALSTDPRIGSAFLNSGCGYGGSCLPKDVKALSALTDIHHCKAPILQAINLSNEIQKAVLFDKLHQFFEGDFCGRKIALWGLSFKPRTDDIRCAPSCTLLEKLWGAGAVVGAYDPLASDNIRKAYPKTKLILCNTAYEALENSDVLVIVTEWEEFRQVDFARVRAALNFPLVLDGRNMFRAEDWHAHGVRYCGIGSGDPVPRLDSLQRGI